MVGMTLRATAWNTAGAANRRKVALKIAYFDCFAGISGDMTLGALVDAGADFERLKAELGKLGVEDYELKLDRVIKRGIAADGLSI